MNTRIEEKIHGFIQEKNLFSPGDTVILAVSGGADSVAMLNLLCRMKHLRLNLVVAHLNHLLRGEESDGDESFVRSLAFTYSIPFIARKVDVKGVASRFKLSLEESGRKTRYEFFREVADNHGASSIALAHNSDDQAETVLMRLLRGAAGSGLAGMSPRSVRGLIVRPLLCVSRKEIEAYLHESGIGWREDSSNAELHFLRNRIRHQLLPTLRTYNPEIAERLNVTATVLAADDECLSVLADEAFKRCVVADSAYLTLNIEQLAMESRAVRLRIFRKALASIKGDLRRIGYLHLEGIEQLFSSLKPSARISLPDGVTAFRNYGLLSFRTTSEDDNLEKVSLVINGPGSFSVSNGVTLTVQLAKADSAEANVFPGSMVLVDGDRLPFPWDVRQFLPGDRIRPIGMNGSKKVKDLFIDRKVSRDERRRALFFFSCGVLFWIGGIQLAEHARITAVSRKMIRISIFNSVP